MIRGLSLMGTTMITVIIAVAIVTLVAGAVRDATKPVPGWVPTPSATAKQ